MKKCIRCLYDDNEEFDRQLEALETLRDWCEDINFAIGMKNRKLKKEKKKKKKIY